MNKIAVAASMLLATATGVGAQTNVTLYGAVDAGINSVKVGSKSALKISEGGIIASQIGFRGSEDLGGGLKALFQLEGGISIDTGDGNIPSVAGSTGFAFTRQAYMGLDSNWGAITMGRQYTPTFVALATWDQFVSNGIVGSTNLWFFANDQPGHLAMQVRQNNSLMYKSPATFPFRFQAMYGAGEAETPSTQSGRLVDLLGAYVNGPIRVSLSRQERKTGSAAAPVASPATSIIQLLAADYSSGAWRFGVNLGNSKSDIGGVPSAKFVGLMTQYQTASGWTFLANIQKRDVASTSNDQTAYTIGVNYDLSKRTALYGRMLTFNNGGTANMQLGGYTITAGSATPGDDGRSILFGVLHRF